MFNRTNRFSDNHSRNERRSDLVLAAQKNDIHRVAEILSSRDYQTSEYRAALMKASGFGHLNLVKGMTNAPENSMEINIDAAKMAAQFERVDVFFFFVNEKNVPLTRDGEIIIEQASQFDSPEILKAATQLGHDFADCSGRAFQKASKFGHDTVAAYLLNNGAPWVVEEEDVEDRYARHSANTGSYTEGNRRTFNPNDVLFLVAAKGDKMPETIDAIIKREPEYDVLCNMMVRAASYGQIKTMVKLLDAGADVNYNKVAALSEAARFNQSETLDYLLRYTDYQKSVGLQRALKKAHDGKFVNISKKILRVITDENSGQTLQSIMVRCLNCKQWEAAKDIITTHPNILDNKEIVNRIVKFATTDLLTFAIDYGLDVFKDNLVNESLSVGNWRNAEILLEEGASIEDINEALVDSAKHGGLSIVKHCVANNADLTYMENAAVNWACQYNHEDVVEYLASLGEKPNGQSLIIAEENRQSRRERVENSGRATLSLGARRNSFNGQHATL